MTVDIISFSFKRNDPPVANYLIDVRFINNPFYIDELRLLTGLDNEVVKFFKNDKEAQTFIKKLCTWIEYILEANKKAKKEKIIIAIGCTGGQHRSPYITERLAEYLTEERLVSEVSIYHNELKKYNVHIPA